MWFCPYFYLFSNIILIEREDSEKQYPSHYANDYAGIITNWNRWLAQVAAIFSTQVSYAIGQKCTTKFLAIQRLIWSYPCFLLFSNKILIEKEDSEKQHLLPYTDNLAGINANWNRWLATIFSIQVYALGQKKTKVHWVLSWLYKPIIASLGTVRNYT